MERLKKNVGGYRGETIDIPKVLREIEQAVAGKNWTRDMLFIWPPSTPPSQLDFIAYRRLTESA